MRANAVSAIAGIAFRAGSPYGFTVVGAGLAAGAAMMLATFLAASNPAKAPTVQIETSQSYRLSD